MKEEIAFNMQPTISVKDINKAFGSNRVLKGIDMEVMPGEVVALVGGNGAGKSTLMKIIMGIYKCDKGQICMFGEETKIYRPSIALAHGIYLVPQEPLLFPNMTIEENILMGFSEKKSILRVKLENLMKELGWEMDLSRRATTLSIAEQQLVEILRGLMREAKLLIFDEPTSSLTFNEVRSLFEMINKIKAGNISIIYITHRLSEVFQIADRAIIMSDGVITLNKPIADVTHEMLVQGLLPIDAKRSENKYTSNVDRSKKPVFKVDKLKGYGFRDISFELYPGEVLGIAGIVGAGRTELATTIFGKEIIKSGKVILDGKDITGLATREIISKGLNYVPEDRFLNGIFRISTVAENTTAACLDSVKNKGLLSKKKETQITRQYIDYFKTKVTGCDQIMGSLSGGNQQKVVIGRSLAIKPKVLILDEPTRGIDAAARSDVYSIINQLRAEGLAILLISSDMEEIIELSDRAITMYSGRINGEFEGNDINQDNLMAAAFGLGGNLK